MKYKGTMYSPMYLWTDKVLRNARIKAKSEGEELKLSPATFSERCRIYHLLRTDPSYMNKDMKEVKETCSQLRYKKSEVVEEGLSPKWHDRAVCAYREWKGKGSS